MVLSIKKYWFYHWWRQCELKKTKQAVIFITLSNRQCCHAFKIVSVRVSDYSGMCTSNFDKEMVIWNFAKVSPDVWLIKRFLEFQNWSGPTHETKTEKDIVHFRITYLYIARVKIRNDKGREQHENDLFLNFTAPPFLLESTPSMKWEKWWIPLEIHYRDELTNSCRWRSITTAIYSRIHDPS